MAHTPPSRPDAIQLVVVDDDFGIRTLLEVATSLDPRFALIGAAGSGAELLELLRTHDDDAPAIDVVLLDVTLPDGDGIDLLHDARAAATQARIALFTGWTDSDTLQRAQDAGADAVFSKDGDSQRLLDSLAALCD